MVVADGVIFVGAVEASAAGDCGAQRGEFLIIPPGMLRQEHGGAGNERRYSESPEPAKSLTRIRCREEVDERNRENGHPAPWELHEAQFREQLPDRKGRTQHQRRRNHGQEQEGAPKLALDSGFV